MNFEHLVQQARRHPRDFSAHRRAQLAAGQQPLALFITCSDSRVIPSQITGAEPGKLFELRTAGNVVPEYNPDLGSAEMATIEYAVLGLRVPDIVVCGHSHCGAVTALSMSGQGLEQLPAMRSWLRTDELIAMGDSPADPDLPADPGVRDQSKQHVRAQLQVLNEYPFIREKVRAGETRLHGWFYEIDTGLIFASDPESPTGDFMPL